MENNILTVGILVILGFLIALVYSMHINAAKNVVKDISLLYRVMQRVINNTDADRFLILGLHNGGRKLDVHSKRYITIFEEVNNPNVPSIKGDYKKVMVDGPYIHLINQLISQGVVFGWTKDLPGGLLKEAYQKDGINYYHIFYIGYRQNTYFFGSASTTSQVSMEDSSQWMEIKLATNKIKQLINKRRFF